MEPARVLIVDDNAQIRRAWGRALVGAGYQPRDADSLGAARRFFENWHREPCDFILLDLHLGDGLGEDLLPLVDQLKPRPAVAVLSGFLDNETTLRLCGRCVICLSKPITTKTLVATAGLLARNREGHDFVREYATIYGLSARETEVVLAAISDGGIVRTADRLHVASSTVISYWRRVFKKTHCSNQREVLASLVRFTACRCDCYE